MVYATKEKEEYTSNIFDLLVENAEADFDIFNLVIESDFMEAAIVVDEANDLVTTSSNDKSTASKLKDTITSKMKEIVAKIGELIQKLSDKVMDLLDTWLTKLQNLFHDDAKLYSKYHDDFMKNAQNLKVKYRPVKENLSALIDKDPIETITNDATDGAIGRINALVCNCSSKDAIDQLVDKSISGFKEKDPAKEMEHFVFAMDDDDEEVNITNKDAEAIDDTMKNGQKMLSSVGKLKSTYKQYFKNLKESCSIGKFASMIENSDLAYDCYNALGKIYSAMSSYYVRCFSALINNLNKALAQARRIFLMGARWKEPEAATEAYIIGELSDIYMEQTLLCYD